MLIESAQHSLLFIVYALMPGFGDVDPKKNSHINHHNQQTNE